MNWICVKTHRFWGTKAGTVLVDPPEHVCSCGKNRLPLFIGGGNNRAFCYFCKVKAPRSAAAKRLFCPLIPKNLGVTEQEANELYNTNPVKEKQYEKA